MAELGENVHRELERLSERMNSVDLSSSHSSTYIEINRGNINKLDALVGIVQSDIEKIRVEIGETNKLKLDERIFYENHKVVTETFSGFREEVDECKNGCKQVENFIEKYLPIKVQNQISETLAYVLMMKEKKKLEMFEKKKYGDLHFVVLEDQGYPNLEAEIKKIHEGMINKEENLRIQYRGNTNSVQRSQKSRKVLSTGNEGEEEAAFPISDRGEEGIIMNTPRNRRRIAQNTQSV